MSKYSFGKFEKVSAVVTVEGVNSIPVKMAPGDELSNLTIAAGNYGSKEERVIEACTVKGFTMKPIDVKRGPTTIYDSVPSYIADPNGGMYRGFVQETVEVRDIVVEIPANEDDGIKPELVVVDVTKFISAEVIEVTKIDVDGQEYASFDAALEAMSDGSTMTFESNVTLEGPVTLPENANVTIMYNGHQITNTYEITVPATTTLICDAATNQFVAPEGYVINRDMQSGGATWKYTSVPSTWPVTVTKADGSVKSYETPGDAFNATRDSDTATLNEDINVTISLHATDREGVSSGHVVIDLNGHTASAGANSSGGCYMTVKNGTISNNASTATKAIQANGGSGTITVEDGVTVIGGIAVYCAPGYNDTTAEVIVNGGTFTGSTAAIKVDKASGGSRTNGGKVTVNGGTFNGNLVVDEAATLIIAGGTFNMDPTAYVVEGATVNHDEAAGTWTVVPPVNG